MILLIAKRIEMRVLHGAPLFKSKVRVYGAQHRGNKIAVGGNNRAFKIALSDFFERAQDAAFDMLTRPSPSSKRRLDISNSKPKRAPLASLRHGHKRRSLQTEVSQTKTVSFTVRLWGLGQSGDAAASELATAAADGSLTTSLATASTNAGYDNGPACSGDANTLEALQAVTIAEGAPSASPVIAPTPAPSAKPTFTFKPTMDAYEQCLEPACSCDSSIAACTGDDEDDDADEYCDNGGSDVSSDIAGTVNHGSGVGWCMSTLDEKVGCTASPSECWAACEGAHGDKLVAIDWYADGSCWCQDDCPCMDFDLSPVVITRADITLPNECTICDYYGHALYGDCAGSDASDACQSDYYQAIECHYEAQLAELGETCPTQTCVEVLATPAPTPRSDATANFFGVFSGSGSIFGGDGSSSNTSPNTGSDGDSFVSSSSKAGASSSTFTDRMSSASAMRAFSISSSR